MKIINKSTVTSTNDLLKEKLPRLKEDTILIAAAQTKGKGRRGRQWISLENQGFYASFYLNKALDEKEALLLGVLSAKETLMTFNLKPRLKLPNDVYVANKKIGGVLIERHHESGKAVIGVGINLTDAPLRTATALKHHLEAPPSLQVFTNAFIEVLDELKTMTFTDLFSQFHAWFKEQPLWAVVDDVPYKVMDINPNFTCFINGKWYNLSQVTTFQLSP